uniref:Uncharacterized protein n=1 Tax=Lygus hesperus TaxID=30085 RepID=A0A0A9YQN6_LYGHE
MHTIGFLSVSTVFLIAYHSELVNCDGEEGWTNTNNPEDVSPDHSSEASHNNEDRIHENQEPTEHSNIEVSPPQHDWSNEENGSSGMANPITEPSNGHGWSENPLQTDSQASPATEQDWKQEEQHQNESTGSTSSDSQHHDAEHQHPTPSDQWSTTGDSQAWTDSNDSHGN